MKRALVVSLTLAVLLSTSLIAKGVTKRITVRDVATGTTIELTDVERFNVWEGGDGFIINWSAGTVHQRPQGLRHYEVRFYVLRPRATTESLAYVVRYEYDPASQRGFVYLPGRADDHYHLNVGSIHRGVEGQWFNASREWQKTIGPAVAAR